MNMKFILALLKHEDKSVTYFIFITVCDWIFHNGEATSSEDTSLKDVTSVNI